AVAVGGTSSPFRAEARQQKWPASISQNGGCTSVRTVERFARLKERWHSACVLGGYRLDKEICNAIYVQAVIGMRFLFAGGARWNRAGGCSQRRGRWPEAARTSRPRVGSRERAGQPRAAGSSGLPGVETC